MAVSGALPGEGEGTRSLPGISGCRACVCALTHVALNEPETLLCCSRRYLLLSDICCNT